MVRKSYHEDEPNNPITATGTRSPLSTFHGGGSTHQGDVPGEDAFEDLSISNGAKTPSSSRPSLSLKRSSAVRRKSTSTRSSYEGNTSYHDLSNGSSISEELNTRRAHLSLPAGNQPSEWHPGPRAVKRTMSIPVAVNADDTDVDIPASLRISPRSNSFEGPPRAPSDQECAGSVNEDWYAENALLHDLDPNVNQLQVYLLGTKIKHIPSAMDVPASYVVFLPGGDGGEYSRTSPTIARYRCRYPDCEVKWRDEDEHKIHQQEHIRTHLRCQVPRCSHPGFANNMDLSRHLQSVHEHTIHGPFKGYACAAEVCPKKDKVWLKADTFRSHCELHSEDDCEDLLERSRINLGYLDFDAAVRLCELSSDGTAV